MPNTLSRAGGSLLIPAGVAGVVFSMSVMGQLAIFGVIPALIVLIAGLVFVGWL